MTAPGINSSEMFSCDAARRRTLAYQGGHLPANEMALMREHLRTCPECAETSGPVYDLRYNLRALPAPPPPSDLHMRLRVAASKESARQKVRQTKRERWTALLTDWRLWSNNLMRPLAIPAAGGFASALVLFSAFGTGLTLTASSVSGLADIPTGLHTEASVKSYLPLGFDGGGDLVVEITIDEEGRVVDYSLPNDKHLRSSEIRRNIENHLLFTQFTPATSFGQPLPGKVRIWFRSSRIDVKG